MKKYIVYPNWILSKDGDWHYITGNQLISLYRLNPAEVIIAPEFRSLGLDVNNYIQLYPRSDGNYKLEEE